MFSGNAKCTSELSTSSRNMWYTDAAKLQLSCSGVEVGPPVAWPTLSVGTWQYSNRTSHTSNIPPTSAPLPRSWPIPALKPSLTLRSGCLHNGKKSNFFNLENEAFPLPASQLRHFLTSRSKMIQTLPHQLGRLWSSWANGLKLDVTFEPRWIQVPPNVLVLRGSMGSCA